LTDTAHRYRLTLDLTGKTGNHPIYKALIRLGRVQGTGSPIGGQCIGKSQQVSDVPLSEKGTADQRRGLLTALEQQDATECLKGPVVDLDSLPRDSYFDPRWLAFRRKVWSIVDNVPRPGELPLALRYSRTWDDERVLSHVVEGAHVTLSDAHPFRMGVHLPADDPVGRFRVPIATRWPAAGFEMVIDRADGPTEPAPPRWLEPRSWLGRTPYYDGWNLADAGKDGHASLPDACFTDSPTIDWLEWATVRLGSSTREDVELVQLFAAATLCLPALLAWRERFPRQGPVRSTPAALAAVARILLSWAAPDPFDAIDWLSELDVVGVDARHLDRARGRLRVARPMTNDEWAALRLLVPPDRLVADFVLDESRLDVATLA
jgi:hypothetical protein